MATEHRLKASDLEGLALATGASIRRNDGSSFNASGRSGVSVLAKLPTPAQVAPVAAPAQDNSALLAKIVELLAREQPAPITLPEVIVQPAAVVVQPTPRTLDWTFTFEHNKDGSIKSIRAKAT